MMKNYDNSKNVKFKSKYQRKYELIFARTKIVCSRHEVNVNSKFFICMSFHKILRSI